MATSRRMPRPPPVTMAVLPVRSAALRSAQSSGSMAVHISKLPVDRRQDAGTYLGEAYCRASAVLSVSRACAEGAVLTLGDHLFIVAKSYVQRSLTFPMESSPAALAATRMLPR